MAENVPVTTPRRIGLFGGTFDPVHAGHIHLADLARKSLSLDEVRFIPCTISPHKGGSHPASPEDRLRMLGFATAGLPWAVVDDIELKSTEPNYSFRTAELIHERFPDDQLFWIMGGDQWNALPRWKNPEKLAELVEFIVLARNDAPAPREGYRMHLVPGEHPASSTLNRKAFAEAREHEHLSPEVAEWVLRQRLYSGVENF